MGANKLPISQMLPIGTPLGTETFPLQRGGITNHQMSLEELKEYLGPSVDVLAGTNIEIGETLEEGVKTFTINSLVEPVDVVSGTNTNVVETEVLGVKTFTINATGGIGGGGDNFSKTIYVDGGTNYESYANLSNARMGHTDMPYKTLKTAADRAGGFVIQGSITTGSNVITSVTLASNLIVGDFISYKAGTFVGIVESIDGDEITLRVGDIALEDNATAKIRIYPKDGFRDIVVMSGEYSYEHPLVYGESLDYQFGGSSLYRPGVRWYFMPGSTTTLLATSGSPLFMVTRDDMVTSEITLLNANGYDLPTSPHMLPKGDIYGQGIFKGESGTVSIYAANYDGVVSSSHVSHMFEFDTIETIQNTRSVIDIQTIDDILLADPFTLTNHPTYTIKGNAIQSSYNGAVYCLKSIVNIDIKHIIASSNVSQAVTLNSCFAEINIQKITGNPSHGLDVYNSLGGKINLLTVQSSLNNIVVGSNSGVDYDQYNFTSIETHCDTVLVNSGRVNINGKVGFITLGNNVTEGSYDSSPDVYCEWVLYGMNVGSACRLYIDVFGTKESLVASDSLAEGGTSSLIKGSVYIRDCNLYRRIFRVGMPIDYKAKALLDIEYLHSKYDTSYSFIQLEGDSIVRIKDLFFDDATNYAHTLIRESSTNTKPNSLVLTGMISQDAGALCKKEATGQLFKVTCRGAFIQPKLFDTYTVGTELYIHGTLTTALSGLDLESSIEVIYGAIQIQDYTNTTQITNIQYNAAINEDEQYA